MLRSDDVFSSENKDTRYAGGTQSPKGYHEDTFERREEQPKVEQMVAKRLPCITSCIGAILAMPCLLTTRSEQRERARTCNGLRPVVCSQLAQDIGDIFLGISV